MVVKYWTPGNLSKLQLVDDEKMTNEPLGKEKTSKKFVGEVGQIQEMVGLHNHLKAAES